MGALGRWQNQGWGPWFYILVSRVGSHISFQQTVFLGLCFGPGVGYALFRKVVGEKLSWDLGSEGDCEEADT